MGFLSELRMGLIDLPLHAFPVPILHSSTALTMPQFRPNSLQLNKLLNPIPCLLGEALLDHDLA